MRFICWHGPISNVPIKHGLSLALAGETCILYTYNMPSIYGGGYDSDEGIDVDPGVVCGRPV